MSTRKQLEKEIRREYKKDIAQKKSCRPKFQDKKDIFPVRSKDDIPTCYCIAYNSPITWEQFMPLPDAMKIEYLNRLKERFHGISRRCIAAMMGRSDSTIGLECKRLDVTFDHCTKVGAENFYSSFNIKPYDPEAIKQKTKEIREAARAKDQLKEKNANLKSEIKSLKSEIKNTNRIKKDTISISDVPFINATFIADASDVSNILKQMNITGKVKITVSR